MWLACMLVGMDWAGQAHGKGRVTDFTLTTPHLTQLPSQPLRKQGVFLFIKQNETTTSFIPREASCASQTKRQAPGLKC
jgi:hypothetical protein